ncbi:methionine/alanine import family NSS transporter small subunit [Demequina sp. NBRC 110054]|nr:methionine/alanine import family NSS transporter small subunit [Demequina sp. NBRC 110054]
MSADALLLMLLAMAVIWGGLAASIVFLARAPEHTHMPPGGEDDPPPSD